MQPRDTISAVATPPGRGGIGIVRVSGEKAAEIARQLLGFEPAARNARYTPFLDSDGDVIDQGIALYFAKPHSFTGEDVLELQGHGGPVVMEMLLRRTLELGARLANAGEFSERAFLNDKIDLTQAEAIADLIDAETEAAARLANRTLQGALSEQIHSLVEQLISLRLYVEAAIDFPEEEIDFLSDVKVSTDLQSIVDRTKDILKNAQTGRLLRDGMTLVIAGRPNAGKSSLLNALAGGDSAIVTEIPGTTRDILRERISLDGMPLHIIDTAGLRESEDPIEQEGIRRARAQIEQADRVLWVYDGVADPEHLALDTSDLPQSIPLTLVRNKIDLAGESPQVHELDLGTEVSLAAKSGMGLELLIDHLKTSIGYQDQSEGEFIARRRHLDALERTLDLLYQGEEMLQNHQAGELLAEDLRQAQRVLAEITGEFTADDLLGRIFSSFCIGK
jgi:tRNA modification GTPase